MKFYSRPLLVVLASTALLTACVDDTYDLSDIDTTVRFNVNDLVIPVKLDEILLENILEEDGLVKIVDNRYTVIKDGIDCSFESSPINIGSVSIKSLPLGSTEINLPFVPSAAVQGGSIEFATPVERFSFSAAQVPSQIHAINAVGADMSFSFTFNLAGMSSVARRVTFKDMTLQLPKGLHLSDAASGSYEPSTGLLTLPDRAVTSESFSVTLRADRLDLTALGSDFVFDAAARTLSLAGDICVRSGRIALAASDIVTGAQATNLKLRVAYSVPGFELTSFSGDVKYDFSDFSVPSVDLSDLPDVLNQSGTDIKLVNPAIFLSVNNPLQPYGISYSSGLDITAWHGAASNTFSLDRQYFTLGTDHADGRYAFCMSPEMPASVPAGFEGAVHEPFTSLSDVLSGNGLPTSLSVGLPAPLQTVAGLPLGVSLGTVKGQYAFVAPIALAENSKIVYADYADGWGSDELDDITITGLKVAATITSDIPVALEIKAYPVDADHHQINNVKIEGLKINAGTAPQEVTVSITGDIKGLDGIRYEAVATAGPGGQALSPGMHIRVTNLRPSVSGYYQSEL